MTGRSAGEWRTMVVAGAVHAGWLAIVLTHRHSPWWLTAGLLAVIIAWHGSVQHELLHGHPFRSQRANDALGSLPLGLRLAYPVYRRYHLLHHRSEHLTDPSEDPESYYLDARTWHGLPAPARWFWTAHNTLLGRLVLGPAREALSVYRWQWREVRRGDHRLARWWATHFVLVAVVIVFLVWVVGFPIWVYLLGAYAGHSLGLVRSFCEHRWVSEDGARTAMVRSGAFWSLLFLNNNLHLTHHERPEVPWYRLPALADELDSYQVAAGDAGLFRGYWEIGLRFGVRPFDHPVHPRQRAAIGPVESTVAQPAV